MSLINISPIFHSIFSLSTACRLGKYYYSNLMFYCMHSLTRKHCDYDDVRKFTVTCLNKFEHDMTPKDIQESIMPFINR